jgi:predicted nucleic acid-binding protein
MAEKSKVIIDSDILIKILRGNKIHKAVLESLAPDLIISCITQLELLLGCLNKKMQDEIEESLNLYTILPINNEIISIANNIIKKYSFSHKQSIGDSFIAATAIHYSLEVYTDNKKDFAFIDEITLFSPETF